jgi:rare lipoprotein A
MRKADNTMNKLFTPTGKFRLAVTLLLVGGGLVACSTLKTGMDADAAPLNPKDAANTPDAVPRDEPLSRYGNMESYEVYGKRYYTLPSSKGYKEQGTADLYAMTAAHKTLPLPTFVEVTNLNNGRTVIVKVNDRGPFHDDRLIDLSYAAATRLDILPTGTGRVEIRAIDPNETGTAIAPADTPTVAPTAGVPQNETLYLQVGAFSSRDNAERLQRDLQSQNIGGVRIVEATTDAGTFYKVQVGPLTSHIDANRVTQELKILGIARSHSIVQ